jgi:predicted amidohydrolase
MKSIHIAIASTTSKPGAVADNLRQIAKFAEQAGRDGADLLLTPEMSASGYGPFPEILKTAEVAGRGKIYEKLAKSAEKNNLVICAGFAEANGKKIHISHYVVYPDGKYLVQRKHRVTLAERPLDPSVALSGPGKNPNDKMDPGQPLELDFKFFEVRRIKCAIAICADSGIEKLDDYLFENKVRLLLVPTGAGGKREDRVTSEDLKTEAGLKKYSEWLEKVFFPGRKSIEDSIKYNRALAAVNMCGYDGKKHYHLGHGMIITPMGEVPALFHGLPNLDRQRPMYTHAVVDFG